MLIWNMEDAKEHFELLVAGGSLGKVQMIKYGDTKRVYVLPEEYFYELLDKERVADELKASVAFYELNSSCDPRQKSFNIKDIKD